MLHRVHKSRTTPEGGTVKILAGLHDTPEGRAALDYAIDEAKRRGGELVLVAYVPNPRGDHDMTRFERDRSRLTAAAEGEAAELRDQGLKVTTSLPVGPYKASGAILEVARNEDVDLIVIGMRRRSRVGKVILGSNAQDILLEAEAPVISIKAPESAA
jgi:nucleotide-binding universal stress UspA family protein